MAPSTLDMFSLAGRTAMFTGGTRGIGASMAVALAEAGSDIILIQRDTSNTATKSKIESLGRKATIYTADLASATEVAALTKKILHDGHDIDLLVTCAGIQIRHPAHLFPQNDWDAVLQVNLSTVFTLCRDVGAYMLSRKPNAAGHRGSIVNIASLCSFQGGLTVPAYAAAKGGVAQLTKALSNEWASKGINVNAIAPGYIATEMTEALQNDKERAESVLSRIPAGRWGNPDDFKGPVVFLASPASACDETQEQRSLEPPLPNELQVAIHSTGICGSDQHYYSHFANGDILVREPLSLGHESSGIVTSIGSDVPLGTFAVGDRVALEVDNKSLPASVSTEEGALVEPLSVAIHGIRRAGLAPHSTTLVIGAGAVGLLTAAMLRVSGSSKIVICDIETRRVDFATENEFADLGFVVPMKRGSSIEEKLEIAQETAALAVGEIQGGEGFAGFDAVFECTGAEACMQTAIYASRPGGKVVMIGMGTPVQTLPMSAAALREVDLIGVFRYSNTYPYGISVLAGERNDFGRSLPDVSKLITHRFSGLDSIPEAFKLAGSGVDEKGDLVLKVVINIGDA
ncbi:hypothetical protein V500_06278 [Pseudogymnoascus sp. VKM F-4518 (FW-2643)]|nr:hypothetical protein V500_06278 [Pseudogymnoascus sp. VKM F-4518 (FW-2643)]